MVSIYKFQCCCWCKIISKAKEDQRNRSRLYQLAIPALIELILAHKNPKQSNKQRYVKNKSRVKKELAIQLTKPPLGSTH